MRLLGILLFLIPHSLFSQKVEHETFGEIIHIEKVIVDPQTVKVDTLNRTEARNQLNYQLAGSLAFYLLAENRDTSLRLSSTCPNLIFLTEGTVILYWDGDLGSFQGSFIQDREHVLLKTIAACSRVYSIQEPALSDSPDSDLNSSGEDNN
jgi:hypothetical protein